MRRILAFAPLLLIALLAALPSATPPADAAGKKQQPYRIVPGPHDRKRVAGPDTPLASRFSLKGLTVEVAPVDRARRAEFLASLQDGVDDPFAGPPGTPARFTTFRVAFENGSDLDVTFQPGNVVLITNRNEQQFPIDITDLYLFAHRAGSDDPQRLVDRVLPIMFDSSTTIRSGTRLERLLVFGPMPDKWKEFRLHFSFLQIGAETHTLSFIYHKQIEES